MKDFLFVASLPTKKFYFDGERNKSKDVLNSLKRKYGNNCSIVDLSKNQYLQVLKLIFLVIFKKYKFIFVSKCLVGGSKAIRFINKFANKWNRKNVVFYIIGNGSNGFDDKTIYYEDVKKAKHLIVESPLVEKEMIERGLKDKGSISIFPCIKPNYDLKPTKVTYPKDTLKLIYFSRVTELKGLMDAIKVVISLNESNKKTLFELDIAGGSGAEKKEQEFLKQIVDISSKKDYINYLGLNLRIEGKNSYERLQTYDLHIFPSKFYQECAPGSIIDMFIAGVPTLSSTFPSSVYLMNKNDSYFFEMNNEKDLENKLMDIYKNQEALNEKRVKTNKNAQLFTEDKFIECVDTIVKKDIKDE